MVSRRRPHAPSGNQFPLSKTEGIPKNLYLFLVILTKEVTTMNNYEVTFSIRKNGLLRTKTRRIPLRRKRGFSWKESVKLLTEEAYRKENPGNWKFEGVLSCTPDFSEK
ncbi:hypothetical protein E3J85_01210 [Patescibacteria group bacterium]|nr:MAG: hypothetical protein E3J85_01210 [Patescibacteria group bacterium]